MAEKTVTPLRLHSLDALRGFDMLWIIGGAAVVHGLARVTDAPWIKTLNTQMTHVNWEGLHAFDLVFPLFMFLSGITIPYALDGKLGDGRLTRAGAMKKTLRRVLTLIVLGALYNGALASSETPRLASVLGQIGIAYAAAVVVHLFVPKITTRLGILLAIPCVIAALQLLVDLPGYGAGILTRAGSFNGLVDRTFLPGRLYGKTYDPEGLLCIFASATLPIAGALTGTWLRCPKSSPWRRAAGLAGAGLLCLAAGYASWNAGYPAIKALWTAPFILLALGWSLLAFTAFHTVIDLGRMERLATPLRIIGMNSIAIYLAARFLPFDTASRLLFGRFATLAGESGPIVHALGVILIEWTLLAWMYRRKIFITV